jgi:predicted transcriptional regulator
MLQEDRFKKLNIYDNYIQLSKHKILDLMKVLKLEEYQGVKRILKPETKNLTIEEIMLQFTDVEIVKLLVCNLDLKKTVDNVMIRKGYSRAMAEAIVRNIKQMYEYQIEELEIKK